MTPEFALELIPLLMAGLVVYKLLRSAAFHSRKYLELQG